MLGQNVALRNTLGYRHFDDEYWIAEFLDVTPPSRVNRGFLYFAHHRRPWINQAELTGRARLGIDHNFLVGWDYQDYDSITDRKGAANFNTTPMDLYDPVETHVNRDLDSIPITRFDYSTQRTNGIFFQDTLTVAPRAHTVRAQLHESDRSGVLHLLARQSSALSWTALQRDGDGAHANELDTGIGGSNS